MRLWSGYGCGCGKKGGTGEELCSWLGALIGNLPAGD